MLIQNSCITTSTTSSLLGSKHVIGNLSTVLRAFVKSVMKRNISSEYPYGSKAETPPPEDVGSYLRGSFVERSEVTIVSEVSNLFLWMNHWGNILTSVISYLRPRARKGNTFLKFWKNFVVATIENWTLDYWFKILIKLQIFSKKYRYALLYSWLERLNPLVDSGFIT